MKNFKLKQSYRVNSYNYISNIFKCKIYRIFRNRLMMQDGKGALAEKIGYYLFTDLKLIYNIGGIICIYEVLRLINPYVLLLPFLNHGEIRYYVKPILAKEKQLSVAIANFKRYMRRVQIENKGIKIRFLLILEIVQLVLKQESPVLRQRDQLFMIRDDEKQQIFIHYKW